MKVDHSSILFCIHLFNLLSPFVSLYVVFLAMLKEADVAILYDMDKTGCELTPENIALVHLTNF